MRYMPILFLLFFFADTSWAAPSPNEILAASDAIRNPGKSFGVTVMLTEYRNGNQTDTTVLQVYSKAAPDSGQFRSLIRFVSPPRDQNKLMLKDGNELWFYDPSGNSSVRISPQQRLLGQAANGDVVTVNFALDYQASLAGEEEILDGEQRKRHCYKLALTADAQDVTYDHIVIWIDTENNRPIKAQFYAASDRLLKTAYYRRYKMELGAERPTQTVIIDGLNPQWVTVMNFSDYVDRDVPEAWLQRDYLHRFKPQ